MSDPLCRQIVETAVCEMSAPTSKWRAEAASGTASAERHDALVADAACLNTVRIRQPVDQQQVTGTIRVAAWNLERCKNVKESSERLKAVGADICLLTELDLGMARSGNRDTTTELATHLSVGQAFGVEFIELGHGDEREQTEYSHTPNAAGLHGNAVLTRFSIDRAAVLPLDVGGYWYRDADAIDQRRIGGRMAVAVRHLLPEPTWFVAVHYESRLGPHDRDRETEILLAHIERLCGNEPVLIGGDFNCKSVSDSGLHGADVLQSPECAEPMFQRLRVAGFAWQDCNTDAVTTRNHPWHDPAPPLRKIDWFFARGLTCRNPAVVAAVDDAGNNISDHEMITLEITL